MKRLLIVLAACLLALPIAAVLAFLLTPFWRWLEAGTGIESIGHSGPAEWCFLASYGLVLLAAFAVLARSRTAAKKAAKKHGTVN